MRLIGLRFNISAELLVRSFLSFDGNTGPWCRRWFFEGLGLNIQLLPCDLLTKARHFRESCLGAYAPASISSSRSLNYSSIFFFSLYYIPMLHMHLNYPHIKVTFKIFFFNFEFTTEHIFSLYNKDQQRFQQTIFTSVSYLQGTWLKTHPSLYITRKRWEGKQSSHLHVT